MTQTTKPAVTAVVLSGTVEKIIKALLPGEKDHAQIAIHNNNELDRSIRIENTLTTKATSNAPPEEVSLKNGVAVKIIIQP
jgi:hypothetical protein